MTAGNLQEDSLEPESLAVRFFHLDKLAVAQRSGLGTDVFATINAGIAGIAAEQYSALREEFGRTLELASDQLAQRPGVAVALQSLPFHQDDVVVALGDSITDDLLSWAHLLDNLLAVHRPDLRITLVNSGYTGNTTQEAISRFDTVAALRPNWILQMLGTNDARRHGSAQLRTTTPEESDRNFAALAELAETETDARLVVLTPPPADGGRADEWTPFAAEKITWKTADVDELAAGLRRRFPDALIDVHLALRDVPTTQWLLPDGIHPSLRGQMLIAETVLLTLSALEPRTR